MGEIFQNPHRRSRHFILISTMRRLHSSSPTLRVHAHAAICSATALQTYWFFAPRNRANPMSDQTIEAFRAEGNRPNAETKAALDAQLSRDAKHNGWQHLMVG